MDSLMELLTRGVEKIYPSYEELEKVLKSGKKLKLYQGFDPTGTQLHLGHMIGLRKLRQWQDRGHEVIFLIGDGTGQAGDPSGKMRAREKFLTHRELRENASDYVKQAGKIVNFEGQNPVKIMYNGDWLNKLTLPEILEIAGHFSLQQLAERDLFQERMKKGESVNLREFLYPLLQGYDSVALKVDLEIGGSDQTFNMLIGRSLAKEMANREKFVMTTPLLTDSQGVKIGKTEGNVIALTDKPEELFGKIMSLPDEIIVKGLDYLTDISQEEIKEIEEKIKAGQNPMEFKKKLAFEITKQLSSLPQANQAKDHFEKVIQQGENPSVIPSKKITNWEKSTVVEVLLESNLAGSKSEARRLIEQSGIRINNQPITNPEDLFSKYLEEGEALIQKGRLTFLKIEVK